MMVPSQPLPEPLRGSETGSFAHHTVTVRLGEIARRTLEENDYSAEIRARFDVLLRELPLGLIRPLDDPGAPDFQDWEAYLAPYLTHNWLDIPWFFAEAYFYRRLLEAGQYFQPGAWKAKDPFTYQKRIGLEQAQVGISALVDEISKLREATRPEREIFTHLLSASLWGNQVDLSIWPAGGEGQPSHATSDLAREHLLVDDTQSAFDLLTHTPPGRVDFLLDNAGFELVCDLLLVDFMLENRLAEGVRLHVKLHPTFVSDTMPKDLHQTLAFLAQAQSPEVQTLSTRLTKALENDRLQIRPHLFWTSPLPLWQMPASLQEDFRGASLVISKGDANYRRSVGDLHWPFITAFEDVVGYFPAPLLMLRTLKSEVVVGLQPGRAESLFQVDAKWMTNGRWGVIQFYPDR